MWKPLRIGLNNYAPILPWRLPNDNNIVRVGLTLFFLSNDNKFTQLANKRLFFLDQAAGCPKKPYLFRFFFTIFHNIRVYEHIGLLLRKVTTWSLESDNNFLSRYNCCGMFSSLLKMAVVKLSTKPVNHFCFGYKIVREEDEHNYY